MAKFIIGVIVGISLGASATAYGAGASRIGTLSGWVPKHDEAIILPDRPVSVIRSAKS
jgi:hypothetical protein